MVGIPTRWIYSVLCIVQCCSLALHNAYGLFPNHLTQLSHLLHVPAVYAFGQLTGSGTAHGFFAPQVASMFILQLRREKPGDNTRWNGPPLRTTSGKIRYVVFLNHCQYVHAGTADSLRQRQILAVLHQLAFSELPPQLGIPTRCTVYAVKPVPLGAPWGTVKPQLAILYDTFIPINPDSTHE